MRTEAPVGAAMSYRRRILKCLNLSAQRLVPAMTWKTVRLVIRFQTTQELTSGLGGGGTEYFTIWLTGIESSVPHFDSPSNSHSAVPANTAPPKISASSNPSSSKTTSNDNPLATTTPGSTPTSSSPTSSKADENSQRRKPDNKRPVILGVVLGLTAFTAFVMMALIFWCLWRRRRGTGRFFRHGNASSLSNEPLRPDGEAESITASSTYSAEQWGPGWEEQTANTLDAMQSALNSNTRNHSGPIASDHVAAPPPSEQRSNSRLLSTELEAREYRNDNTLQHARELPTPFSPTTSMQSPRPNTLQPNFKQSASISITVSADESTGPVSPPTAKKTRKQSRSLIVHYPSGSEVDGFDFCGSGENPLVGKRKRESWHPSRERRDGRYELA